MDEKQSLIDQKNSGDALREIQNHQGWSEIIKILSGMYQDGVISLIDHESLEVRANLKAIENLASQIRLKIDFGKVAAEDLRSARFNLTQDTP